MTEPTHVSSDDGREIIAEQQRRIEDLEDDLVQMEARVPADLSQARKAWEANRDVLMAIWRGELDEEETFHDTLPWLFLGPRSGEPWAVTHLD